MQIRVRETKSKYMYNLMPNLTQKLKTLTIGINASDTCTYLTDVSALLCGSKWFVADHRSTVTCSLGAVPPEWDAPDLLFTCVPRKVRRRLYMRSKASNSRRA